MGTVKINDRFFQNYRELVRSRMLPYQWAVLNDAIDIAIEKERDDDFIPNSKSHAIENFMITAGRSEGEHYGWVFQDSDVYKWLEAAAYSLTERPDEELIKKTEWVVKLISDAQQPDGYINTYFTIKEPERRFKRLWESHELYCAGHFFEAACAYHEATGSELVLETAERFADYLCDYFGTQEGKILDYDGHEEVEIGLLKLYALTGKKKYLDLTMFFLDARGVDPDHYKKKIKEDGDNPDVIKGVMQFPKTYNQTHAPVRDQDTAEGHAVRLTYMCIAMVQAGIDTGDETLIRACEKIWENIVTKRMYVTGGIGSTVYGESFTFDYDLNNETMYCETCAGVGMVIFAYKMLKNRLKGGYGDIMEKCLYNTVLSGMALDGEHFFYVNPLEVVPEASAKDHTKSHVKAVRPQWLGCACCPPNLARLLTSLDKYLYIQNGTQIVSVLPVESEAAFELPGGNVNIKCKSEYPWNGNIIYEIEKTGDDEAELAVRIPEWAECFTVALNGTRVKSDKLDGFVFIKGIKDNDTIELDIPMMPQRIYANVNVRSDVGCVAIQRGPVMYCMEGADNGDSLHLVMLPRESVLTYEYRPELLSGVGTVKASGERIVPATDRLYSRDMNYAVREQEITFIPYYAWANRGVNEMRVWVREK